MNKTTKHNADFINAILTGEAGRAVRLAQTAAELRAQEKGCPQDC